MLKLNKEGVPLWCQYVTLRRSDLVWEFYLFDGTVKEVPCERFPYIQVDIMGESNFDWENHRHETCVTFGQYFGKESV